MYVSVRQTHTCTCTTNTNNIACNLVSHHPNFYKLHALIALGSLLAHGICFVLELSHCQGKTNHTYDIYMCDYYYFNCAIYQYQLPLRRGWPVGQHQAPQLGYAALHRRRSYHSLAWVVVMLSCGCWWWCRWYGCGSVTCRCGLSRRRTQQLHVPCAATSTIDWLSKNGDASRSAWLPLPTSSSLGPTTLPSDLSPTNSDTPSALEPSIAPVLLSHYLSLSVCGLAAVVE